MQIESSLEKLWKEWYPKVYAYFYKRVDKPFEVEELTANTMNTVFLAKNLNCIEAYMWKVAHNYLVKYINTKSTTPITVALQDWDAISEKSVDFEMDEEIENTVSKVYLNKLNNLKDCIKKQLKPEESKLVELSIYEDKNSTEIGKILDIKPDTVRQKLSRCLKKLREKCKNLWLEIKQK